MNQRLKILYILITGLMILAFFNYAKSQNVDSQDPDEQSNSQELDNQIDQKQQELSEIEEKIKKYENLVEKKQNQQSTLNNQIEIIEAQVDKTNQKISETQKRMKVLKLEIESLELKIEQKKIEIEKKQKILGELIKGIYHSKSISSIEVLLKYDSISEYFSQMEKLSQINYETKKVLDEIHQSKLDLEKSRTDKSKKYEKLADLKSENLREKNKLKSQQENKEDLLQATQGQEEKYQQMLEKFQAQRQMLLGDIDQMTSQKAGELAAVISQQKKPTEGLASTSWYFSQRDSRWAGDYIGMSRTRMDQYGCAVTSVSMVLRYHGVNIDPGVLARQPIFYYDLIVWPSYWQGVKRVSSSGHGNIDWDLIDEELKNNNPVIVFIGAKGKGAGHYVVIHTKNKNGAYVVHDPYWGPNVYLTSTRQNISVLYDSSTYIDQMIFYHGPSGSSGKKKDPNKDSKEPDKEEICEDSGGDWDKKKQECDCPKDYQEQGGMCVEE
ncbi:MAG: hypothetical protein GF335_02145 [Candidatus Moranbacteria bacterium]|nr:hypothetical protein [Candidatus Moranbacteria bacterium]